METFTTNMAIQNISKSKEDELATKQEVIDKDTLKKLKLIEKAFK